MRLPIRNILPVAAFCLLAACATAAKPVVVLLSDFGLETEAVGQCHGAVLRIAPEAAIVDLCHNVEPYDIRQAAIMLRGSTGFPDGTVFCSVVDPGVGTARKAVAVRTKRGLYYVAPDNGILSAVIASQGFDKACFIDEKRVNPDWKPGTFDGRDLFSPAAAVLAASGGDLGRIGRPARAGELVRLDIPVPRVDAEKHSVAGEYVRTDKPYGNAWTNIGADDLTSAGIAIGDQLDVRIPGRTIRMPFVISFGDVAKGKPLAYINSSGSLALAINEGNFSSAYGLRQGAAIIVRKSDAPRKAGKSVLEAPRP